MWHEQRAEERKMKGMMVDRRKRAERRREHYERISGDPNQFMQVHGRSYKVHLDPAVSSAADSPASMMPWAGDNKILIDRFDARANLDHVPEYKEEVEVKENREMRAVNYERYRILVQNEYLGVGEEKFLKTVELEEKFGGKTYQQNKAKDEKKKSSNKAAIGFVYRDSAAPQNLPESEDSAESESDDSDLDLDLSVDVMSLGTSQQAEINLLGVEYQMGKKDFVKFIARDVEEVEELRMEREEDKDKNQASGRKSRRQRRILKERKAYENKFRLSPPSYALGAGAKKSPRRRRSRSKSSDSESDAGEGKVEFITCFGGGDSDKELKKEAPKKKKEKRGEYEKLIGPSLPSNRSRSRSRQRFKSRSRERGRRSRSRERKRRRGSRKSKERDLPNTRRSQSKERGFPDSKRSKSKERDLPDYNTWSGTGPGRGSKQGERKPKAFTPPPAPKISAPSGLYAEDDKKSSSDSSDSSDNGEANPNRYRSKYRNKRADSSDDSDEEKERDSVDTPEKKDDKNGADSHYSRSMASFFTSRVKDKEDPSPPPTLAPVVRLVEPPPVKRYYGRRKENDSDSELSMDSDSESTTKNQPSEADAENGNGGITLAAPKEEKPVVSIKDKLKKKMLQQIRKTFKEDKKAELERLKKAEEEQAYREEELREMSEKLRAQARERRRLAGESDSEDEHSPLTSLWMADRESRRDEDRKRDEKRRNRSPGEERRRGGSGERKRDGSGERKREGSGERKRDGSGERKRDGSGERSKRKRSGERRRSGSREKRKRSRSRGRDREKGKVSGLKLVDY